MRASALLVAEVMRVNDDPADDVTRDNPCCVGVAFVEVDVVDAFRKATRRNCACRVTRRATCSDMITEVGGERATGTGCCCVLRRSFSFEVVWSGEFSTTTFLHRHGSEDSFSAMRQVLAASVCLCTRCLLTAPRQLRRLFPFRTLNHMPIVYCSFPGPSSLSAKAVGRLCLPPQALIRKYKIYPMFTYSRTSSVIGAWRRD